jgi:hypothetical protein
MTEDEAKKTLCHRMIGSTMMDRGGNTGGKCMAWRWIPLQADEAFKAAVIKAKEDIGDKTPAGVKASQHVIANRAAYGLPAEPFDGFCGLAGKL